MMTAIDIQIAGVDFDDDAQMDAIMASLSDCSFSRIDGIAIMTVFSKNRPLDDAVAAIRRLESVPGARAVRVYLDLVDATQIAHRVGLTRKPIRKWSRQEGFPEPVAVTGKSSVWAWSEVEIWLTDRKGYFSPLKPPTAQDVADINVYIAAIRELAVRFANQDQTRAKAVDEIAEAF